MIKNWLVTGDTHGQVITRLMNIGTTNYPPEETALIILGDAGINFYLNKTDMNLKRNIQNTNFTIYCVRGNHEERPENLGYIEHWYDENVKGYVMYEPDYPNIKYFEDGSAYEICGKSVLVIGGAYSVDKWYRLSRAGVTSKLDKDYLNPRKTGWFPDEQLLSWEMTMIEKEHFDKHYDVILTHTCPISWEPIDLFLPGLDQSSVDKTMELWLDEVKQKVDWNIWLFGHYHGDQLIRPGVEMYYKDIENWETIIKRWESPDQLDWWLVKSPNYYMGN